ncbi:hypothetical protein [Streptomyces sp. NPDC051310]|uniref:hypothetical protein n=1 Tax=Streptomyces sp. NPDC051310 TaxID=3365649 RepID=UPI0037B268BD
MTLVLMERQAPFGGAEPEFGGHTAEWVDQETEYCAAWAHGEGAVQLKPNIRPAAAHRASGAAENTSATPMGLGWNGSFAVTDRPEAGVLVDGASLPGNGLLVLAEARQDIDELSDAQVLQVARFATESARRAAERLGCEGPLGQRPATVDRSRWQRRPAAQAEGTCRGVLGPQDAARLRIATVSEMPVGGALTEECSVKLPAKGHHVRLTAYSGPSAQQETYLDYRCPGSVKGAFMRSHPSRGALGTAYFKFEEIPGRTPKRGFEAVSAVRTRNGC